MPRPNLRLAEPPPPPVFHPPVPLSQITPAADDMPLAPPLLWAGCTTLLSARAGVGKSTLSRQAAAAISCGRPFLDAGCAVEGNVLYLTGDERPRRIRRYFDETFRMGGDCLPGRIFIADIDDMSDPFPLHQWIVNNDIALMIVDPIADLVTRDIHASARMDKDEIRTAFKRWLPEQIGQYRRPATLCVHHQHREREQGRGDAVSKYHGSVGWETVGDLLVDIETPQEGSTDRALRFGKSRVPQVARDTVCRLAFDAETRRYRIDTRGAGLTTAAGETTEGLWDRILALLAARPTISMTAAARELGIPRGGAAGGRYERFRACWNEIRADLRRCDP